MAVVRAAPGGSLLGSCPAEFRLRERAWTTTTITSPVRAVMITNAASRTGFARKDVLQDSLLPAQL
jgi:multisubunit Na+/H+ antiporter MnhG subunit